MPTTTIFIFVLLSCFLQLVPVYCGSDDLFDSWKKIHTNYANDIEQGNKLYSKIKEEQRALAELRTIVERHLRTKTAELLVNTMKSENISMPENNLAEVLKTFKENYDQQMIESILAEAIDKLILTSNLSTLPDLLWGIYQQNDTKLFEIMLRSQLQLYNSLGQKHHTDRREFLHFFANKLYKIKQDHLYKNVDLSLKLKIQNIVQQLPNNLKYLYFMPYFCLLNIKHLTYIYTGIKAKKEPSINNAIWLWHDSRSMDDTGYIKAEAADLNENNEKKLYVTLKGIKYQMYYYIMSSTMKIAGWDFTDAPPNYIWNIEFLDDDRVVFSQNDYLMCAVENYNAERRNIAGRKKGEVFSMSPECQWRLGECIFK